ncbi:MAG: radical SAM protein [Oscillospiraceae bacterium]|nr:radical SAM protein [Oscillospiraceae bacterium]
MEHLHTTKSICPVCGVQLPADIVRETGGVFLKKTCPAHGSFSALIWRDGGVPYEQWGGERPADIPEYCPNGCSSCSSHGQDTCCILVEVTNRCNLRCSFCFADGGAVLTDEPTVDELADAFRTLAEKNLTFIQLSGGEPTVRDDLPEIVAAAKVAGATSIQLNTNGIRLAKEPEYTKKLADAGLTFVFLQFDSTDPAVTQALRGGDYLSDKLAAIDLCGSLGLGVTLVPTVVPGLNSDHIGDLIRFAISKSPVVRGVHFQPVSYFGRCPYEPADRDRFTLPELLNAVVTQTEGLVSLEDISPSCCDHPRCGFHSDYIVLPDGLLSLNPHKGGTSAVTKTSALSNRCYIARRWKRDPESERFIAEAETLNMSDMATFLAAGKSNMFTLTAMAFQDRWNLDLERLNSCSLHVWDKGSAVPFCARYITAEKN